MSYIQSRRRFLGANWKARGTPAEVILMCELLKPVTVPPNLDCVLFPQTLQIEDVVNKELAQYKFGTQDIDPNIPDILQGPPGGSTIKQNSCDYVIVGHIERRYYFREDDYVINCKAKEAINAGLTVVFCVSGSHIIKKSENELVIAEYMQRTKDLNAQVVVDEARLRDEVVQALQLISRPDQMVFAFEAAESVLDSLPLPTSNAQYYCHKIREIVAFSKGSEFAQEISIVYGGGVKEPAVVDYVSQPDIDGLLIGSLFWSEAFPRVIQLVANA